MTRFSFFGKQEQGINYYLIQPIYYDNIKLCLPIEYKYKYDI